MLLSCVAYGLRELPNLFTRTLRSKIYNFNQYKYRFVTEPFSIYFILILLYVSTNNRAETRKILSTYMKKRDRQLEI
jgi:hypothetical protein